MRRFWLVLAFSLLFACASEGPKPSGDAAPITDLEPTLVLVSLDGFRAADLDWPEAKNLRRLGGEGVRTRSDDDRGHGHGHGMIPSYPTLTFPNHYTLMTGLYPEHNGIVANDFLDPETGERFRMTDTKTVDESKWWLGEPFWVSVERRGLRAATMFWVGSTTEIEGYRPTYWRPYVHSTPIADRLGQFFAWLDLPAVRRPRFLTLYFENVDEAGHEYGPDAPQTHQAVEKVDEAIGELRAGLEKRGIFDRVNLIVVADHGMAAVDPKRGVRLDRVHGIEGFDVLGGGAFVQFWPKAGTRGAWIPAMARALNRLPGVHAYPKARIPARFHYQDSPRIAPLIAMADEGGYLFPPGSSNEAPPAGAHGYDNELASMRALFVARGPAFRERTVVDDFPNVDLYPLMAAALLPPPARAELPRGDYDYRDVRGILREP